METAVLIYYAVLAGILGACVASFFGCLAYRRETGESFTKGKSHCDLCGHTLGLLDLFPIFSYLFLKGKCRYCGGKIPPRSTVLEAVSLVASFAVVMSQGFTLRALELLLLCYILIGVAAFDLESMEIPDALILSGIALRLIFMFLYGFRETWLTTLIGGFSIALPLYLFVFLYEKLRKKEAMGGGDIKLVFMLGLFSEWKVNLLGLILACIFGIALFYLLRALAGKKENEMFPFGPAIALGYFTAILVGEALIGWYLGLMNL